MHIDIEYMKEFLAMCEETNYTEAAEKMFISQSTLFKHIKTLESELGVPLFVKSGRRIAITSYGKIFEEHSRKIIAQMEDCMQQINSNKETELAMVRLGAEYRTHDLVKEFCSLNDEYRVKVTGMNARKLLDEKKCDLAILLTGLETEEELAALDEAYEHIYLTDEYAGLLVSKDHPISKKETITIDELRNQEFIAVGMDENDLNYRLCQKQGFKPNTVSSVYVGSEAVDLVAQNIGICILNKRAIDNLYNVEELGACWIGLDPEVKFEIGLYWRRDTKLSKASKRFIRFVQDYYTSLEME